MNAIPTAQRDASRGPKAFRVFLRVSGVLTLAIFVSLLVGFLAQSPLLAEHGGMLNWTIWNDVRCGGEHMHVPPMLMVIYIVWGVFLLRAAGDAEEGRHLALELDPLLAEDQPARTEHAIDGREDVLAQLVIFPKIIPDVDRHRSLRLVAARSRSSLRAAAARRHRR